MGGEDKQIIIHPKFGSSVQKLYLSVPFLGAREHSVMPVGYGQNQISVAQTSYPNLMAIILTWTITNSSIGSAMMIL
jgi:hypothetical protein